MRSLSNWIIFGVQMVLALAVGWYFLFNLTMPKALANYAMFQACLLAFVNTIKWMADE
jgi:hypothetical protein